VEFTRTAPTKVAEIPKPAEIAKLRHRRLTQNWIAAMTAQPRLLWLTMAAAALLAGCATGPKNRLTHQTGESVVLIGEEPAALAYAPARGEPLAVRNTYLPGPGSIAFVEGRDFVVDYAAGTLRRGPDSRLP
jgi:hypothetical protein